MRCLNPFFGLQHYLRFIVPSERRILIPVNRALGRKIIIVATNEVSL
jgi:hypothetical protein